ncbi:serine/threonine-protein kinase [Streptomyces sp. NPDC004749]
MEKLAAEDPRRIGAYRLLACLGAGGMGRVYLGRSERGRTVAVKLVREELAREEQFRDRFRREVAAARRVGGAWTAPVLDADTEAPVPWLATGYVAGPSLQSVVSAGGGRYGGGDDSTGGSGGSGSGGKIGLDRPGGLGGPGVPSGPGSPGVRDGHGPLPERSVRILASGLAHALQDIHAAGLIHRDLKPSNILITIDGPRVIDFGIARALETVTDGDLTRTGSVVGSPGFMAPEQIRGDRVTAACDVFCLGSVLMYAATGRLPFGTQDTPAHALMFRIAQEEPDLSGLPEDLAVLVRACLKKDPAARPTTRDILARVGEPIDSGAGRGGDPWLPGPLLAELGQHAVQLLEYEGDATAQMRKVELEPDAETTPPAAATTPTPAAAPTAVPSAAPTPEKPVERTTRLRPVPGTAGPTGPTRPTRPTRPIARPSAPATQKTPETTGTGADTGAGTGIPPHPTPQPHQTPPGSYGYPPAPAAAQAPYGYATPPYGAAPPPSYGAIPQPAQPQFPHQPPSPERSSRGTAVLITVTVIVAILSGLSVYAFLGGHDSKDAKNDEAISPNTPESPVGGTEPDPSSTGSGAPTPSPSASAEAGDVPAEYVGTWTGGVNTAAGHSPRRLVIAQGNVGETVLSLTADGPAGGSGGYHCVFEAPLASAPAPGAPLSIGPSTVAVGEPMTSCTPGTATKLTLLPDGTLRRTTANGESLIYTKGN